MSLPDQTPKLPKLPFLIGDAALLATAWYLVHQADGPLTVNTIAAVTACVALGAVLGAVPFLANYARKQDEALDERQRSLDALASTVTTAAEQISIATSGLQQLTENLHKNVKHAEQLPHKLQEKIAEFNAQLDNAREDDREELEKELVELRSSESERLAATAEKIHRAAAELTKLDAAAQKQIASRVELLQRASDTIAKAHADASIAINDVAAAAARDLAAAHTKALNEIDARLEARAAAIVSTIEAALAKTATPALPPVAIDSTGNVDSEAASSESPTSEVASPPKRPRKARRDDSPTEEAPAPQPPATVSSPTELPSEDTTAPSVSVPTPATTPAETSPEPEPPPVPGETIAKIEPIAPVSASPFPVAAPPEQTPPFEEIAPPPAPVADTSLPPTPESFPETATAATPPNGELAAPDRSPKKRAPKKPAAPPPELPLVESAPEEFSLSSEDEAPLTSRDVMERVISSDGATRLIATAYIGIGNRLFIRGEGPGLSWEKGVPLQFVSIGKWRWETPDATAPIQFKLYKNDDTECPGLGTLTLDPGHQQEVTAKF